MRIYLFVLSLLFLVISCKSQKQEKRESSTDIIEIVSKTKNALNKLQTLSAELRAEFAHFIPGSDKDNLKINIDFTVKRNNQDSIVGWYFKSQISNILKDSVVICRDFCDGKNYYSYQVKENILYKSRIGEANRTFLNCFMESEMNTYFSFFNDRVRGNIFNGDGFGTITRLKDTVINGRYSYLIRNQYDNLNPSSASYTKSYKTEEVAIDTLTHIPLYFYKHYKIYEGRKLVVDQKSYHRLSNLKVNEDVDDKIFECNLEIEPVSVEDTK